MNGYLEFDDWYNKEAYKHLAKLDRKRIIDLIDRKLCFIYDYVERVKINGHDIASYYCLNKQNENSNLHFLKYLSFYQESYINTHEENWLFNIEAIEDEIKIHDATASFLLSQILTLGNKAEVIEKLHQLVNKQNKLIDKLRIKKEIESLARNTVIAPNNHYQKLIICNLQSSDEKIIKDFKAWLDIQRKQEIKQHNQEIDKHKALEEVLDYFGFNAEIKNHNFKRKTDRKIAKLIEGKAIEALDIIFWHYITQIKLTQQQLGEKIFPKIDPDSQRDRVRQTTLVYLKQLTTADFFSTLH